jgi:beta-lactamase class A
MAQRGRRNADHKLLMALACGATVESAARQAGVSESTAHRRMEDAAFRQQWQALRADMMQRTAGAMTAASTESVRTLLELQKPSAPPAVRLGAARSVLELGIKLREAVDLEERLSALEQQLGVADACRP